MTTFPQVYTPKFITEADLSQMRKEFKRDKIGHVYFFTVDEADAIKIGFGTDVKTRLQCLQTGNHMKLQKEFSIKTCPHVEQVFQRIFEQDRIRLEWFNYSDAMNELIECFLEAEQALSTYDDVDSNFLFTPEYVALTIMAWECGSWGKLMEVLDEANAQHGN